MEYKVLDFPSDDITQWIYQTQLETRLKIWQF